MIALLYQPAPGTQTGHIIGVVRGPDRVMQKISAPHIILDEEEEDRDDWDRAFTIVDGQKVELDPADIQADALYWKVRELMGLRGQLLRDYIDSINPVRWSSFTPEQQDEVRAYREVILAWPRTADPFNPVPPLRPSFLD